LHTHIDDEYARAGVDDPKILLTTSRDPSSRLLQFVKEMKSVFPNSQRINRGAAVIKELIEASRANDVTDLVIVHEHRGEPDGMIISHLPYGPTAYFGLRFGPFARHSCSALFILKLTVSFICSFVRPCLRSNVVMRHDIKDGLDNVSEALPHLIFDRFDTKLGRRVQNILKYLFPVPKLDSQRVMTFANQQDFISFRCVLRAQ
jgi:U3 small nucleolar ribonucleoprotein protein IMP4